MHDARSRVRTPGSWPPAEVRQVAETFLSLADETVPGLVEGLYLHGSLGFGEWYDGRSDIDYVAVLDRPPADVVEALRVVHARISEVFPAPPFDGFHLTWDELAAAPNACPDVPCTQAGLFHAEARLDVHPVTWHELARHGVTVRGPALDDVDVWTDRAVLRRYTHDNLRDYWAPEVEQLHRFPDEAGKVDQVPWFVLGTSRLHHLLATDALTSKTGAGRYALEAFDERWHPIVGEAMTLRQLGEETGHYDDALDRRAQDTIGFAEMVVATGLAIPV